MSDRLTDDVVEPTITSAETAFSGLVWDVRRESFELDGRSIVREFVRHPGAVAVLAIDDRDRVLLIKQYRHPVRLRDWELPAGLLDLEGEAPAAAAERELAEEVDLIADEWAVLADFMTSPGGSDESIRVYVARGLSPTPSPFVRTEEEAGIETRWVALTEVVDAVLDRTIRNSILCLSALAADASRSRGWSTLAVAESPHPRNPR